MHRAQVRGQWLETESLGGTLASNPAATAWGVDQLEVFAVFPDGELWDRFWDGRSWHEWESLGGELSGDPAASSSGAGAARRLGARPRRPGLAPLVGRHALGRVGAAGPMSEQIRIGALCWNQYTDWPSLLEAGRRAERLGFDTLWTWDHLYPIVGSSTGPMFEGWLATAAWAQATERVRIGLMVGANTFRNPALVAKMATTLDHLSNGRAILGIGAAWFGEEHEAFGLEFGSGPPERLRWLGRGAAGHPRDARRHRAFGGGPALRGEERPERARRRSRRISRSASAAAASR